MEQHSVLRVASVLLKVLAWIALVGGLLVAVMAMAFGGLLASAAGGRAGFAGATGGLGLALVSLLIGVIYFLVLYAYGDVITVLLRILENTQRILQRGQEPQG